MPLFGLTAAPRLQEEPQALVKRGMRFVLVGTGLAIMVVGAPIAVLPYLHIPGLLVMSAGLVIVLRNSFSARRKFIKAQRRHPRIVFPIRRLIRREPEVVQVFWQQTLRLERLITPGRLKAWRICRRTRLMVMRRKARTA